MRDSIPRWLTGSPRTRFQLALVLVVMFAAILGGKVWEESHLATLRQDCNSLFEDRLMPATMLLELLDELNMRRDTLQRVFADETAAAHAAQALGRHKARQDDLVLQFEQTYLVGDEQSHLASLRTALADYDGLESALLERHASGGESVEYDSAMQARFEAVRGSLLSLSKVQQAVGAQLETQTARRAASMASLLYFQLGAGFVLGLVAAALAMSLGKQTKPTTRPNGYLH